jgi:hypothetical protein
MYKASSNSTARLLDASPEPFTVLALPDPAILVASVSLANQFPSEWTRLLETHPRLAFPLFHLLLASRRVGVRAAVSYLACLISLFFADIMLSSC